MSVAMLTDGWVCRGNTGVAMLTDGWVCPAGEAVEVVVVHRNIIGLISRGVTLMADISVQTWRLGYFAEEALVAALSGSRPIAAKIWEDTATAGYISASVEVQASMSFSSDGTAIKGTMSSETALAGTLSIEDNVVVGDLSGGQAISGNISRGQSVAGDIT